MEIVYYEGKAAGCATSSNTTYNYFISIHEHYLLALITPKKFCIINTSERRKLVVLWGGSGWKLKKESFAEKISKQTATEEKRLNALT